jgi:hypothetical protein
MADAEVSPQAGAPDATDAGDHRTANNDRGRRWYHPRPEPRCRADVMGVNYTFWLLFCILLVVIVVLPW